MASDSGSYNLSRRINIMDDTSPYVASLRSSSNLQFRFLMENLDRIEDTLDETGLERLERDILVHIGNLGALKLFHACLSRTLMAPTAVSSEFLLAKYFRDYSIPFPVDKQEGTKVICTGKKEERKLRRTRASSKRSDKVENDQVSALTQMSMRKGSCKLSRALIAQNESEMANGLKVVVELEKTRVKFEQETGRSASYAKWAEAVGIDLKTLQQQLLFGWYCRDRLIKSTRSLVIYLAKNYRGLGIEFDELIQAGNIGVLKGAERFDNTRGCRFSTYVQYWIRKSMSALLVHRSNAIRIPNAKLDALAKSPDDVVTKQLMRKHIMDILEGLKPRERTVLVLRYGLEDGRCRSLGEIAYLSCVTKEWIRKIEKAAMSKVRREDIKRDLKFYLHS